MPNFWKISFGVALIFMAAASLRGAAPFCEQFDTAEGLITDGQTFGVGGWLTAGLLGASGKISVPGDGYLYITDTAIADCAMVRSSAALPATYSLSMRYRLDAESSNAGGANNMGLPTIVDNNAWVPQPNSSAVFNSHTKLLSYHDYYGGIYRHMLMYQAPSWTYWLQSSGTWQGGFNNTGVLFSLGTWYRVNVLKTATTYTVTISSDLGVVLVGPATVAIASVQGSSYGDMLVLGDEYNDYNFGRMAIDWICIDMLPAGSPTPSFTQTASPSLTVPLTLTPTPSPTPSPTSILSPTRTVSPSPTPSPAGSPSPSPSPTAVLSPTPSPVVLVTGPNFWVLNGLYPNPFSDRLTISFGLDRPATLQIAIFNVAGEPIWQFSSSYLAGQNACRWAGVNSQLAVAASGVYLVSMRFQADDGSNGEEKRFAVIAR